MTTTHAVQFNPVVQVPIKLQGNLNFVTWKAQLVMLLKGYKIIAKSAPITTITQTDSTITNPEYEMWFCKDHLIQHDMMESIDLVVVPTIAIASSSK